ncbi:MBL fold metallo-hydrolase [Ureibacillus chungkukjangi]|uniref:MBL fold metallo-hydrolase n=1 Tax=Ureibacillus chungkukjangi TaxID=1202712 RepID=UPI00203CD3B8|nr:MBL fold metallo-hydrolase [Ureibacillus chungkukjangi]MCM3387262.1 MBL fold metallo-hydrolase [Ureibacillus chungkukjangi]
MLKFIGSGSAFNTKLGNNSAYYKEGNQILLIDCGSNIFQRIKENNLLEGIEQIHVLVTHTHADHVGSLADLILYTYYSHGEFAKNKIIIHSPFDTGISEILKLNGCVVGVHHSENLIGGSGQVTKILKSTLFNFDRNSHVEELNTYNITLNIKGRTIWYSSDCNEINKSLVEDINFRNNFIAYIDTCKADYNGNVHLSLRKLTQLIKPEYRNKVWCMHLDEGFVREEAEALGFNVVKNEY